MDKDRDDIRAGLQGDGGAYARLLKRYEPAIAKQMWRFTRDPAEHEELVQDVFVEAYRGLGGFRERAPFLHWLRRVATQTGYQYWKRKARDKRRQKILTEQHRGWPVSPENAEPSEAAEVLHRLLERLGAKDRLVLTLLYFDECSIRDIAEQTGWSRTLVKVRAHRARRRLKRIYEENGFGREHHA